jgi:copper chaperone NosL
MHRTATLFIVSALLWGCGNPEVKPVEIYPEDMCATCRMAVTDQRFASEIISEEREAFKFDDIGCLETFTAQRKDITIVGTFYKDFVSKEWIGEGQATVVATGVSTPMGSGKVAFADRAKATEFQRRHPVVANEN